MKTCLKSVLFALAACTAMMSISSCSDDNDNGVNTIEKQNESIKALSINYLNKVVYTTYGDLASETDNLYSLISTLKTNLKSGKAVAQSDIDAICNSYKAARAYWEESEAFLYGAASDFEIDPHIDTWPLNVATLATDLQDKKKIEALDQVDGIEYARVNLTKENLGFHGIEFIFFRDGKNRSASFFNNNNVEIFEDYFKGKTITAKEEVIFAAAVAGDLRDKCFQLEVAWNPDASKEHKERVAVCAKNSDDFKTTVAKNALTYGQDILAAGQSLSTYNSWKKVVETILVSGCSNICAEVADQKMGQAYRAHTGKAEKDDDPNYIESPYSYNSYTDFYDNIISIQNSVYGNRRGDTPEKASIMGYLNTYNVVEAALIKTRLNAALLSLKACQNSGVAFVQNPGSDLVKQAMDAIGELDEDLNKASAWIMNN